MRADGQSAEFSEGPQAERKKFFQAAWRRNYLEANFTDWDAVRLYNEKATQETTVVVPEEKAHYELTYS